MADNTIRKSSHPISCFFSILPHGQFFIVFLFFWERKSCIHGISGQATIHHLPAASCCRLPAPPLPARGITCPDPAPGGKARVPRASPQPCTWGWPRVRTHVCARTHTHTHTGARHALAEGPPGGAVPSVESTTVPQMLRWLGPPPRLRNTCFTRPRGPPSHITHPSSPSEHSFTWWSWMCGVRLKKGEWNEAIVCGTGHRWGLKERNDTNKPGTGLRNKDWGKDLPGGPAVKTAFPCRGRAFDPWSGSSDPTCHLAWSKKLRHWGNFKRCNDKTNSQNKSTSLSKYF